MTDAEAAREVWNTVGIILLTVAVWGIVDCLLELLRDRVMARFRSKR